MALPKGLRQSSFEYYSSKVEQEIRFAYDASSNVEYIGTSLAGNLSSKAVWKIRKCAYDASDNITLISYADDSTAYNKIWDNREGYSY